MVRRLLGLRRQAFGLFVVIGVLRIPARTGFHLAAPSCDVGLSLSTMQASLMKMPHVILFGVFCALALAQFDRLGRRAVGWSLAATAVLGAIIELEEGATRTGNCRLADLLPDLWGALIVAAVVMGGALLVRRVRSGARVGGVEP